MANKIIYRSAIRSALDPSVRNKRLVPLGRGDAPNPGGEKVLFNQNLLLNKTRMICQVSQDECRTSTLKT
jgi:hypothetical protein